MSGLSDSELLRQTALTVEDDDGNVLCSATLVHPRVALTVSQPLHGRRHFVLRSEMWPEPKHAQLSDLKFEDPAPAALVLESPSAQPPPEFELDWTTHAADDWVSWHPIRGEFVESRGRIRRIDDIPARRRLILDSNVMAPGAAVISRGRLLGLVMHPSGRGTVALYLVPGDHEVIANSALRLAGETASRDIAVSRLSLSSRRALGYADALRRALGSNRIHMEHLLLGLYAKQGGPTEKLLNEKLGSRERVREVIGSFVEQGLPEDMEFTEAEELPQLSGHVREAIELGEQISISARADDVQSRHLLYGVLSHPKCHITKRLNKLGITPDLVKLTDEATPLSDAGLRIAGVAADGIAERDLLGIDREVQALAAVVAAKDAPMPISIGLFGNWGTGKSTFMSLMERAIDDFSESGARDANNNPYFCENVVQIRFNAWTYMDTDLWASLAAEIFEQIGRKLDERAGGSETVKLRDRLKAAAASAQDVLSEAEQQRDAAQRELAACEEQLAAVEKSARELEVGLSKRQIALIAAKAALEIPEVSAEVGKAASAIGLTAVASSSAKVRAQLLELHGATGWARGTYLALQHGGTRGWLGALAIATLALAVVLVGRRFQEQLAVVTTTLVTAVGVVASILTPILRRTREAMRIIDSTRKNYDAKITKKRDAAEARIAAERAQIRDRAVQASDRVEFARSELQSIERQLEALRSDRQMAEFLRERRASEDYKRHFGTVARARSDFERLADLVKKAREENKAGARGVIPPINRIVLYIDDLDRCPEDKVFAVLQAVHLLLALPIFAVVVGVDSRWLMHSIRASAGALRDEAAADTGADERERWRATPVQYLEKIFQIPFNLQPIGKAGYDQLLDDMLGARVGVAHASVEIVATGTREVAPRPVRVEPSGNQPPIEPVESIAPPVAPPRIPPPASLAAEHLQITPPELDYMKLLHPLVGTPRGVKRLVNTYRLLRASTASGALIGGEARYRDALILLAMVTGFPSQAVDVIQALGGPAPHSSLRDLLTSLGSVRPGVDTDEWSRFVAACDAVLAVVEPAPDVVRLGEWAPTIARYSFQSVRARSPSM